MMKPTPNIWMVEYKWYLPWFFCFFFLHTSHGCSALLLKVSPFPVTSYIAVNSFNVVAYILLVACNVAPFQKGFKISCSLEIIGDTFFACVPCNPSRMLHCSVRLARALLWLSIQACDWGEANVRLRSLWCLRTSHQLHDIPLLIHSINSMQLSMWKSLALSAFGNNCLFTNPLKCFSTNRV